jgi:hypothetical protein
MYDDLVKTFTANGYVDEETQRNDLAILKLVAEVNEVVPVEPPKKLIDYSGNGERTRVKLRRGHSYLQRLERFERLEQPYP